MNVSPSLPVDAGFRSRHVYELTGDVCDSFLRTFGDTNRLHMDVVLWLQP